METASRGRAPRRPARPSPRRSCEPCRAAADALGRDRSSCCVPLRKLDDEAHAVPRAALVECVVGTLAPDKGRPCDVEGRPRALARELTQELGGEAGAGLA